MYCLNHYPFLTFSIGLDSIHELTISEQHQTGTHYSGWEQCPDIFKELNVEKIEGTPAITDLIRRKIDEQEMEEAFFLSK